MTHAEVDTRGRDERRAVDRPERGGPHPRREDRAPYAFTGTAKQVVFDLEPSTHEDGQGRSNAVTHGVGA